MAALEPETRIVVGLRTDPTDPARAWWWEVSTTLHGADLTVAGYSATENDAILEAAARALELRLTIAELPTPPPPKVAPRSPEADFWGLNGDRAPERAPDPERSASGSPEKRRAPRSAAPR